MSSDEHEHDRIPPPTPPTGIELVRDMIRSARVLRRGRHLPPETATLESHHIDAVRADFKSLLEETGMTLKQAAAKLGSGFSIGVLSKFKDGEYEGDTDRVARAVNKFVQHESRAHEFHRRSGFVETEVAKRIMLVAAHCYATKCCGVVMGPSGIGKTMTAQAIEMEYPGTLLLRLTKTGSNGPGIVRRILDRLSVRSKLGYDRGYAHIVDRLKVGKPMILIDEAHLMGDQARQVFRDLHDETGCPILFLGTGDLYQGFDDFTAQFGQWTRRIGLRLDLAELFNASSSGGRGKPTSAPLFSIEEIRAVFDSDKLRLTDDGADFLATIASIPGLGCLGFAAQLVNLAAALNVKSPGAKQFRSIIRQQASMGHIAVVADRSDEFRNLMRMTA